MILTGFVTESCPSKWWSGHFPFCCHLHWLYSVHSLSSTDHCNISLLKVSRMVSRMCVCGVWVGRVYVCLCVCVCKVAHDFVVVGTVVCLVPRKTYTVKITLHAPKEVVPHQYWPCELCAFLVVEACLILDWVPPKWDHWLKLSGHAHVSKRQLSTYNTHPILIELREYCLPNINITCIVRHTVYLPNYFCS